MQLLNVLRSPPDALVRRLVDELSRGKDAREEKLFDERVDYDRLVKEIFEAERVVCWW